MQLTARVVDAIAFAQGIEAVALTRVTGPGHGQGIEDGAVLSQVGAIGLTNQGELVVEKAHVERGVMDDQLRALDELEKFIRYFSKARLAHQEFVSDAVDTNGALVTFTIGLQVHMKMAAGQSTAHQLDATDLDHPVAIGDRHTGGFSIEYNTTHA